MILLQIPYLGMDMPGADELALMARTREYAKAHKMHHVIISRERFPCDEFVQFEDYIADKDNRELADTMRAMVFEEKHAAQLASDIVRFDYAARHEDVLYCDRDAVPPETYPAGSWFAKYGKHGIDQCVFYMTSMFAYALNYKVLKAIPVVRGKKMVRWPTIHALVNEFCLGRATPVVVEHMHVSRVR